MNDQTSTDGERFVDQAEKPIPPMNTWGEMGPNQLIDIKNLLEDKLWHFRSNPAIANTLKRSINTITLMIADHGKV
jgi:hypothetical protein